MKKFLLIMACMLLHAGYVCSQVNEVYEGAIFTAMSPNGNWLLEESNGDMRLYNRATGEWKEFNSTEDLLTTYHAGLGKCVTDEGMFVGSVSYSASYCKNGVWTELPQSQGKESGMNGANAITPDGKRICGILANDGISYDEDAIYAVPAVWTLQDDGTWKEEILPYPTLDFSHRAPQYIVADDISDDGKTVVGNVRDCLGFYNTLIVFKQAEDGSWSYTQPLTELVYDEEKAKAIPDYPENLTYPDAESYLTEEQKAQFTADFEEYQEMYNLYLNGTITFDEIPPFPDAWKYIDDEHREQWVADSTAYYDYQDTYWEKITEYQESFNAALNGEAFNFNSVDISANGKWLTACTTSGKTVIINLEDNTSKVLNTSDKLTTGVTNDGLVVVCSPLSMGYTRVPYIIKPGSDDLISFESWLEEIGKKDVLTKSFTGTTVCNADGTIFCGYIAPFEDGDPCSYFIDLNDSSSTGIGNAKAEDNGQSIRIEYYNMAGQRVSKPGKGLFIERSVTSHGSKARKVLK